MSTTDAEPLPWWRYLGPWPLRPAPMFFVSFLLAVATTLHQIRVSNVAYNLLATLATAGIVAATLWLFQRVTPVWSQRSLGYAIAIACTAAAGTFIRGLTGIWITFEQLSLPANIAVVWLRTALLAILALAVLGVSSRRLQIQVKQTEDALAIVGVQADALLRADEAVRQQVASLLHDKVQAGLIAACLHLQDIGTRVPGDERNELKDVITSLERIRSLDVRRAVNSLSPNLQDVDFESALMELAEFYEPSMNTAIHLQFADDIALEIRLGAYRIIEQALLNAAGHGHARHCDISVHQLDRTLHIDVSNDGQSLPLAVVPGLGTTLTSTWCRTLGGEWSRTNKEGGGVRLTAHLPLPSRSTS